MRRTLYELSMGYAAATGCSCQAEEGSCQAVLAIEGFSVQIGLVESSGMIVFQAGVALLPRIGREEFYQQLLVANNLFSQTQGLTLGLDADQELITIQLAWDLSHLDAAGFSRIVHNVLSVAAEWMIRLDTWRPSAPGESRGAFADAPVSPPFMNFIQV
jgi:Tir chaperone protein (CesT).